MWQLLLEERPWTHVLDVGANYGEILLNVDLPTNARIIAFEPNPRILPYLERNLAHANLRIEIIGSAVSDRTGSAIFVMNRGSSGASHLARPNEAAVDESDRVIVPTTTLTAALDGEAAASLMRVLVKIDVEGHEVPVVRGLLPVVDEFEAFAALVEIKHLAQADLEWLFERFDVEVYDLGLGALERIDPGTPERLAELVGMKCFYHQDAVLRRKSSHKVRRRVS